MASSASTVQAAPDVFKAVLRLTEEELPKPRPAWHSEANYAQQPYEDPRSESQQQEDNLRWQKMPSPSQLSIVYEFSTSSLAQYANDVAELAGYCNFRHITDLWSFCDNIVIDLTGPALSAMSHGRSPGGFRAFLNQLDNRLASGPHLPDEQAFMELLRTCHAVVDNTTQVDSFSLRTTPGKIMCEYIEDHCLQEAVLKVLRGCPQPTFIPVMRKAVDSSGSGGTVHLSAFVLCHAAQLLMFAPTTWHSDRKYTRDMPVDQRRFPTRPGSGNHEPMHADTEFSLEDLHRAVLLFLYSFQRRQADIKRHRSGEIFFQEAPTMNIADSVAYHVPDIPRIAHPVSELIRHTTNNVRAIHNFVRGHTRNNEDDDDILGPDNEMLDSMSRNIDEDRADYMKHAHRHGLREERGVPEESWKTLSKDMGNHFKWSGPELDASMARTNQQLVPFLDLLVARNRGYVQQLVDASKTPSSNIDSAALENLLKYDFALSLTLSEDTPAIEDFDPRATAAYLCAEKRNGDDPTLSLFPDKNCRTILERNEKGRDVILANEIGLGKTKVYLALIELRTRRMEHEASQGSEISGYRPSLVIATPSTIYQLYREIKQHWPAFRVIVYYYTRHWPGGDVGKDKDDIVQSLKMLRPDDAKTGRTVIITTFATLRNRDFDLWEEFVILESDGSKPKGKRSRSGGGQGPDSKRQRESSDAAKTSSRRQAASSPLSSGKTATTSRGQRLSSGRETSSATQSGTTTTDTPIPSPVRRNSKLPRCFLLDHTTKEQPHKTVTREAANAILRQHCFRPGRNHWDAVEFEYLVVDDAHQARRLNGARNHMLRLLHRKSLIWVSGTPITSGYRDLMSPLHLMWRKYDVQMPHEKSPGYLPALWHKDYDPTKEADKIMIGDKMRSIRGIFHENFKRDHPDRRADLETMETIWQRDQFPIWQLEPTLYCKALAEHDKAKEFVVKPVLKLIALQRTRMSLLRLPSGKIIIPDPHRLPCKILWEQLQYDPITAVSVEQHGKEMAQKMHTFGPIENTITQGYQPSHVIKTQTPRLNTRKWQHGMLVAHNYISKRLLEVPLSASISKGRPEVKAIVDADVDGGLTYMLARTGPAHIWSFGGPEPWLRWICGGSPAIFRIVDLSLKYAKMKERVLIATDSVPIRLFLNAVLHKTGLQTQVIHGYQRNQAGGSRNSRSWTEPTAKRVRRYSNWNDPSSKIQVLIANVASLDSGINLHICCSKMIIASLNPNVQTTIQAIGRLNRRKQKHPVTTHILTIRDSFNDTQQLLCFSKWAKFLPHAGFPNGALREIFAHELTKACFKLPFNRYAWVVKRDMLDTKLENWHEDATKDSADYVVVGLRAFADTKSLAEMEELLTSGGQDPARDQVEFERLKTHINETKALAGRTSVEGIKLQKNISVLKERAKNRSKDVNYTVSVEHIEHEEDPAVESDLDDAGEQLFV
ncbi:hypothetical protein S40293_00104 [Stachybotrys chartarum IBT 40293]|nr:hypothetical protein S40293_00104 [Stachybotrys chartarum IBT 40293]